MILVTHDQAEALAIGDRVAVLDRGRVVQVGRPLDLYDRPANRFVARFVGQPPMNLLPCLVAAEGRRPGGPDRRPRRPGPLGDPVDRPVGLDAPRPGCLEGRPGPPARAGDGPPAGLSSTTASPATVRRLEPIGHETLAYLALGPLELIARLPPRTPIRVGDRVLVELDFGLASWFDGSTGDRLS